MGGLIGLPEKEDNYSLFNKFIMNILEVEKLIKENFLDVHFQKGENQIIPSKRGMLVVRNRSFAGGGRMLTIVGLAMDFPLLRQLKAVLEKNANEIFSDDVENYQGEAFLYISVFFK